MTTIEKAIETYGVDMQLTVAVEEFSELIKEICKHNRGIGNRNHITKAYLTRRGVFNAWNRRADDGT